MSTYGRRWDKQPKLNPPFHQYQFKALGTRIPKGPLQLPQWVSTGAQQVTPSSRVICFLEQNFSNLSVCTINLEILINANSNGNILGWEQRFCVSNKLQVMLKLLVYWWHFERQAPRVLGARQAQGSLGTRNKRQPPRRAVSTFAMWGEHRRCSGRLPPTPPNAKHLHQMNSLVPCSSSLPAP